MPAKNSSKRLAPRHGPLAPDEGTATNYMKATYEALTARENFGVLRAVGIFGVCVLLHPGSYRESAAISTREGERESKKEHRRVVRGKMEVGEERRGIRVRRETSLREYWA